MKRILIFLLGLIILLFTGCYNFNNPVDPDSGNYQGHPSGPPPEAPSDLTAEYINPNIHLEWTDNSDNETGFKIERRMEFPVSDGFIQIGTVGIDVTTYNDGSSEIQTNCTYAYRVRAYNSYGDSAYSKEASVTIP